MSRDPSVRERAFFGEDVEVVTPATRDELAEVIRAAEENGRRVIPAGLGAHTFPAGAARNAGDAILVSTAAFDRTVIYEPDDFTVGVEAGMPLARLREALAANGQELPVDLGAAAAGTVGGLVARSPVGPRQHRNGPLSSLLLGAEGVRGGGVPFRSGGMVVKNVAGYGVHKLMVGSGGQAGVILRANFRLRPLPERREVRFATGATEDVVRGAAALRACGAEPAVWILLDEAVTQLRDAGLPVPGGEAAVAWLFEGSAARVRWQAEKAEEAAREAGLRTGDAAADAHAVTAVNEVVALAEPEDAPADEGAARLAVLPSRTAEVAAEAHRAVRDSGAIAAVVADPLVGSVHVRWHAGGPGGVGAPVVPLTDLVRRHDGVGRLLYLPPGVDAPGPLLAEDPNAALAGRILRVFDPKGVFAGTGASS